MQNKKTSHALRLCSPAFSLVCSLACIVLPARAAQFFSFDTLQTHAATLAAKPFASAPSQVPESLRRLDYDQYRQINFNRARALWTSEALPFRAEFFHPGFLQTQTVQINEVVNDNAQAIAFSPRLFDYRTLAGHIDTAAFPADMGFTGLRFVCALNTPGQLDELAVFQGASYFRALCKNARYGLSARGLALNTGEPGGEEFPLFTEFWLERPAPASPNLRLWALMESPSLTGAYQFTMTPGDDTTIEVEAAIYRRATAPASAIKTLGVAPLTSMFWFGENTRERPDDLRPEVHDSDGLSIHTGSGEWVWRPLENPKNIRTLSFADENPRGFGLLQRDRDFSHYQDIEAAYHLRPSVWIELLGNWGRGEVRLVELPTPDETNDNIVAFWMPAAPLPPSPEPLRLHYRLHWFLNAPAAHLSPSGGTVIATRQGRSLTQEPGLRRFWVDFSGDNLAKLPATSKIEAVVSVGKGATLQHVYAEKNPGNNTWRAAFAIKPDDSKTPVELRCYLKNEAHAALTETWSYLWTP